MNTNHWDPSRYADQAAFVPAYGREVVALLAPKPGERILDLGCGDGVLTQALVEAGCVVRGVDASASMVATARARDLDVQVMDGRELAFEGEFDAVFSNAALHWMGAPDAVLAGVWRALTPGGRFIAECGGRGNVAVIVTALEAALTERGIDPRPLNPWFFGGVEDYKPRLEREGFHVEHIESFPRPTPLPTDVTGWLRTFAGSFLTALPEDQHDEFLSDVAARCRPHLCDDSDQWMADYVRLRFLCHKPLS